MMLKRELIVEAIAIHSKSHGPNVVVPSSDTAVYFGDIGHESPKSVLLAILLAESITDRPVDEAQTERVYARLLAQYPDHPIALESYRDALNRKYQDKLPLPVRSKLADLYSRMIAKQPQNLQLHLDRSAIVSQELVDILRAWDDASQVMPNNPTVAVKFLTR
ncbi:MAG: hypothetical protein HC860_12815 [Alkalinema sp. RU_4_3]|nr:hypothetical protein [Alkalinema sp. RU_4_3]